MSRLRNVFNLDFFVEKCALFQYKAVNNIQYATVGAGDVLLRSLRPKIYQEETVQSDYKYIEPVTYQNMTGQFKCFVCPTGAYKVEYGPIKCKECLELSGRRGRTCVSRGGEDYVFL